MKKVKSFLRIINSKIFRLNFHYAVSSNALIFLLKPFQGPRLFYLLSVCADELSSLAKIITIIQNRTHNNEKVECTLNSIPYPLYPFLSLSALLVNNQSRCRTTNSTQSKCRISSFPLNYYI